MTSRPNSGLVSGRRVNSQRSQGMRFEIQDAKPFNDPEGEDRGKLYRSRKINNLNREINKHFPGKIHNSREPALVQTRYMGCYFGFLMFAHSNPISLPIVAQEGRGDGITFGVFRYHGATMQKVTPRNKVIPSEMQLTTSER